MTVMSLSAGARLGPYAIVTPLGAGGMGEVYRALDTRLDRVIAIKVLPPQVAENPTRRQRFEREARAISCLSHPHICALYDVGEQDDVPFLVMEHLEGETLAHRLVQGPLPVDKVLTHAIEIVDALEHAHRQRIIHRDLKPSNIMLTRAGVKLLDFGVAKLLAPDAPADKRSDGLGPTDTVTDEGMVIGTLNYMAPEQLEGRPVDARSDLFSFGAVLYEMVTGGQAFEGKSFGSVAAKILRDDLPLPSTARNRADSGSSTKAAHDPIPPLLDEIIVRCLAKSPDDRWQTASDLKQALKWMGQSNTLVTPAASVQKRRTGQHRRPAWGAVATAVAIAILAIVVFLVRPRSAGVPDLPTARFAVHPPDEAAFGLSPASMAISPDGRSVAFHANSREGVNSIWIRSLDSLTTRRLAGTEGATQPFWSPDSRFVAYNAEGKLKKVDVVSGVVQTLHDGPSDQTGTWSREGAIISRLGPDGLYHVPASGGLATKVTTFDQARGETAHSWPQFLPDGRHFLYHTSSTQPEHDAMLYVGSLDSPKVTPLFRTDSHATYVPPGLLLYLRSTTLVAHPFDAASLRLTGEPVPVVERVDFHPATRRGAFSVSHTGVLVYRSLGESQLAWFDRNGIALEVLGPRGGYGNPALSPDGQRVAVDRLDAATGAADIWLVDLPRGGVWSRLTSDPAPDKMPLWFPDGKRIVFTSFRGGRWNFYHRASNGTGVDESMLPVEFGSSPLGWSGDGRFLMYEAIDSGRSGRKMALWQAPLFDPGQPSLRLRSDSGVDNGQLSPDGKWLAYASRESERSEIYVMPVAPAEERWRISTSGGVEPKWRRDGRELFYLAPDRSIMAVDVTSHSPFEAGPPKRLFVTRMTGFEGGSYFRNQYAVTPDGQRFLVNQPPDEATASPLTVVVNWIAAIKK